MSNLKLSKRLAAAAELVREGVFIADVGTDHAYLPIALTLDGRIRGAVASDVNKGPVERARGHVASYGLNKKIEVCLADGLCGIEKYSPEDIFILGMGGELIVAILSRAPWIRERGKRLILQPMTHPEAVRRFLYSAGFEIIDETIVRDDKIYQIICAEYTGAVASSVTELELMFGSLNLSRGGALLGEYLCHWVDILTERRDGKKRGADADTSYEDELLEQIRKILLKETEK